MDHHWSKKKWTKSEGIQRNFTEILSVHNKIFNFCFPIYTTILVYVYVIEEIQNQIRNIITYTYSLKPVFKYNIHVPVYEYIQKILWTIPS